MSPAGDTRPDAAGPSSAFRVGRRLIIEVRWGSLSGHKTVVEPGKVLQVGRSEGVGLPVPEDAEMSEVHFALAWDGTCCKLQDLKSAAGTRLDGILVEESEVSHGGWIRAGATDFLVYFERETQSRGDKAPEPYYHEPHKERALQVLASQSEPLLGVLDAARDNRILLLLRESVEESRSLYEGPHGEVLAEVAPYLVALPKDSALLETLVQEGWGKNWGVFLTSRRAFKDVRRQLGKLLMAQGPTKQELYFRFYDPRVLTQFLPRCEKEQIEELFQGIDAYLMESSGAESLFRFSMRERQLCREVILLGTP